MGRRASSTGCAVWFERNRIIDKGKVAVRRAEAVSSSIKIIPGLKEKKKKKRHAHSINEEL